MKRGGETVRRLVEITNDLGIHLRAAGVLVQAAGAFESEVWLLRENQRANAKSIMSVLSLAAAKGTKVEVLAEGADAAAAVDAVVRVIESGFEHR